MTTNSYERLAQPFSPEAERTLNKSGTSLTYIPVSEVIARLNKVLGVSNWSSEIIKAERDALDPDFVIAHVRLTAVIDGGVTTKDGVGGQSVKRRKNGDIVDLGDEFKGAVSDALKKAAQQMGVGLYLARDEDAMEIEDGADPVYQTLDPEVVALWDQLMGYTKSFNLEQKESLNEFWKEFSGGRPKPALPNPDLSDLKALIEQCIIIALEGERV